MLCPQGLALGVNEIRTCIVACSQISPSKLANCNKPKWMSIWRYGMLVWDNYNHPSARYVEINQDYIEAPFCGPSHTHCSYMELPRSKNLCQCTPLPYTTIMAIQCILVIHVTLVPGSTSSLVGRILYSVINVSKSVHQSLYHFLH